MSSSLIQPQSVLRLRNLMVWTDKSYGHANLLMNSRFSKFSTFDNRIPLINFENKNSMKMKNSGGIFLLLLLLTSIFCGAGIACPELRIFNLFRLPKEYYIFQCEVFAIMKAAETLKSFEITNKNIAICTDSQAAINAISSWVIKSKLVRDCV